jgi:hypothetical protein
MVKYFYLLFVFLSFSLNSFSQETNIFTKFSQNGSLSEALSENSQTIAEFKKNDACAVVDYLGKDIYKIKYKEWIGFVKAEYLNVTDNMIEIVIAFEDKERIAAIKREEERKKEVQEIIRKSEEEKKKQEEQPLLNMIEEAEAQEREREDSIAKVKEDAQRFKESQGLLRKKQEAETREREREDSIAKISEKDKNTPETLERIEVRSTCHYVMNEFDPFYNIKTIRTEPYSISKNLTVELYRQGNSTNIFFNLLEDLGCASYLPSNRSYVKVYLENNDVITFYHSWNMDCGEFRFKGKLSGSETARLKKAPIKSIKLQGTKSFLEITNIDYKEFFLDKLTCID